MDLGSSWSVITSNPWIGFAVFIATTLGLVGLFAGRDWLEAVFGMFRVFFTIFTTPFIFLRDALTVIRNSSEAEQDYLQTLRVHAVPGQPHPISVHFHWRLAHPIGGRDRRGARPVADIPA